MLYVFLEREAQRMYGKPYEDLTDDEQMLCVDFAYEYAGISKDECEREEWEHEHEPDE